jgi:hypothetical protein
MRYDIVNNTILGAFKVIAENSGNNSLASPALNFQRGVFDKIHVIIF